MSDSNANVTASTEQAQKLLKEYYTYAVNNAWIAPFVSRYEKTKTSSEWLASSLNSVESRINAGTVLALEWTLPVYQRFVGPPISSITYAYNHSFEALNTGKEKVVKAGTYTLGAAIVAAQLVLSFTATGATYALYVFDRTQKAALYAIHRLQDLKKKVEARVWKGVADVYALVWAPAEKGIEIAHFMLDILEALVEKTLKISLPENPDASLTGRVTQVAGAVATALSSKAHTTVIDPASVQIHSLLEHISKSFTLMETIRQQKEWVREKLDGIGASASELKAQVEQEASALQKSPEEVLMRRIQSSSKTLTERLNGLKDKNVEIFGDGNRMDATISYLQQLDKNLAEAGDLYKVRDEVLNEARQRLQDLISWTGSLIQNPSSARKDE